MTQNSRGEGDHPLSGKSLDVQGFSHDHGAEFDHYHKENPKKPMMATECCSCLSQRGEDYDTCKLPPASCLSQRGEDYDTCKLPRPSQCKDGNYDSRNNLTCHHDCVSGPLKNYTDAFHTTGPFYNYEISE